jgi:hypothetical protein
MLYRTSHQMLKVSRAGEDQELALLLNMLRVGWRITDVIVVAGVPVFVEPETLLCREAWIVSVSFFGCRVVQSEVDGQDT